jgi:hypothetical protein
MIQEMLQGINETERAALLECAALLAVLVNECSPKEKNKATGRIGAKRQHKGKGPARAESNLAHSQLQTADKQSLSDCKPNSWLKVSTPQRLVAESGRVPSEISLLHAWFNWPTRRFCVYMTRLFKGQCPCALCATHAGHMTN